MQFLIVITDHMELIYCTFTISVSIALILQCIGCLDVALFRYEQILLKMRHNYKAIDKTIENTISRGFSLIDLNQAVNNMFGSFIFSEYGFNLFYTTFGIYFSTTIIKVYSNEQGGIDKLVLFFGSFSIMLVLISIGRIYILQAKGQEICNRYAKIRQHLQITSITFAGKLEFKEQRRLEVLISHFSATPSPVRPWDVFNMNTANFVSVGGIIITYLVVLLQFKLNEPIHNIRGLNMTLADVPKFLGNRTLGELRNILSNTNNTFINFGL